MRDRMRPQQRIKAPTANGGIDKELHMGLKKAVNQRAKRDLDRGRGQDRTEGERVGLLRG